MKIIIFNFFLFTIFQFSTFAQYSVKVGDESGNWEAIPCTNEYEYSWVKTLYKQSEIKSHGTITDIFYKSHFDGVYGPGANKYLFNQRIFMKLVSDNELTSTGFPDTNQMTLVFAGAVEFLNYQLAQIHLDVPFNYTPDYNLLVLYVNKNGNIDNFSEFIHFPCDHSETTNRTVYRYMNGSLQGGTGTYSSSSPVVYFKYSSGLDVGVSAINQNNIYKLPQQADLTCSFRNYMADTVTSVDIKWWLDGIQQTTYNWTGNSYCGQETAPIPLQNNFAFAPGQYLVKAATANPNAGTDELNTNDTLDFTIKVSDYRTQAYQNYSDNTVPFLSNRSYGWSVSIYNKDSIGLSGQINAIAYYVLDNNGMVEPHQKIFMRTTTDLTNTSTNYPDTNLFVKVFDGEIDYSSPGWHVIKLDTVFDYDNSKNLMILYENHAGIATIQANSFKAGWQQTNAVYNYDSNTFPTSQGNYSQYNRVPTIRLFFSIPLDAGVTHLANSNVPVFTGNNDFIINFKNFGLDTLQNVDIKYQIDQNTPNSFHWSGTTNPLNEITNLNIGTSNLAYGDHSVYIWTENPNYLPDYNNRNDTLKISIRACSPLSGTYTIGAAPSDFVSIKAAIDTLNNCGINGAVTFNIKSGTYDAQYTLNEVIGTSATNTITFQSQTGDSTDVILTTDSTDFLLKLNGADYIIFKHLTFTSDSAEKIIVLDSTTTNNQFISNIFSSDTSVCTFIYSEIGFNQKNIFINNNLFTNGATAISINQNDNTFDANLLIQNNTFNNQSNTSINIKNLNNIDILNNNFTVKNTGIYLNNSDNVSVYTNKLRLNTANRGIYIYRCLDVIVANNFISGNTAGAYNSAIYTTGNWQNTNVVNLFYNSINMEDAECVIYCNSIDSLFAFNNIIVNNTSQVIKKYSTNYIGNYNCFYMPNTVFASNESPDNISDLSAWQAALGQDINSIFALPYFTNDSNLHTNSIFVDNLGSPIAGITTDIDGELRDSITPDIGADEFTSTCTGPLSGTYTIGATGNYQTFNDAVNALYSCGVSGAVTFNIESGTYNEQVSIDGYYITYNDTIPYPITFQSQSGDSTDVILNYDADSLNNFTIEVKNISNLIIKNITIQALDTNYGRVIVFDDFVDSIVFSNNRIIGVNTTQDDNQNACIFSDNLNNTDTIHLLFDSNNIMDGSYGICLDFDNNAEPNINILRNTILNQNNIGINLNVRHNVQIIKHNTIESTNNPTKGICLVYNNDSTNISYNKISLASNRYCVGIENASSHNIISNNFISLRAKDNITVVGYYSTWSSNLYNNTILCYGEDYFSYCVDLANYTSLCKVKNNNFVNLTGEVIRIQTTSNIESDYNNLYTSKSFFGNIYNTGTEVHNLQEWIEHTQSDSNSVSFMPDFVSNIDLHTHSALLYQKGVNLPEIIDDIDGEIRNNLPCIGADEFTNPVFNLNDTVFCYYSDEYNHSDIHVYNIGYGYDSYQWSNGSDSSSIIIDTTTTSVGNNQYFVTVTIGINTYTDTVNILYDKPVPLTQTEYCYWNTPITIAANPGFASYQWSNGDTTQMITIDFAYQPNLVVIDNYGCVSSQHINIHQASVPARDYPANINVQDTSICKNQTLQLFANQYDNGNPYDIFSFVWNNGDTTQTTTISYAEYPIGTHEIIATVYIVDDTLCYSVDTVNVTIEDCMSIEECKNLGINIYPNPVSNVLNVDATSIKIDELQIIDITGTEYLHIKTLTNHNKIDVKELSEGVYILRVKTTENKIINYKFVKH